MGEPLLRLYLHDFDAIEIWTTWIHRGSGGHERLHLLLKLQGDHRLLLEGDPAGVAAKLRALADAAEAAKRVDEEATPC